MCIRDRFHSPTDCRLYAPTGELIGQVTSKGNAPVVRSGMNRVTFTCDAPTDVSARARVTIACQGEWI